MPKINPKIMLWARESAGLSVGRAAALLGFRDTKKTRAVDRLAALEDGRAEPSRSVLSKMAEKYRRPLLTFYLQAPPTKGDRGEDFRSIPDRQTHSEALVDALLRDLRARQDSIRSLLLDDEDQKELAFVDSARIGDGKEAVLASIQHVLGISLADYRKQPNAEKAFARLRSSAEQAGIYVLLLGNLGSHHTAIDVEAFRGFALADKIAPFIVINDQDAVTAWSFTLMHELVHLWLGKSGVSGQMPDSAVERFCNDIAASFLLSDADLLALNVTVHSSQAEVLESIRRLAERVHVSHSMVAYRLYRAAAISQQMWNTLTAIFRASWRKGRDAKRERGRDQLGPNFYVVRRHRLGAALLETVQRGVDSGALTPTKAGSILGVRARSVASLLHFSPSNRAA